MKHIKNNFKMVFSFGFIAGALSGFFFAEMPGAISGIISNQYFLHGSYRLIAAILLTPFLKWFFYALLTSLIFLSLFYIIKIFRTGWLVPEAGSNNKKIRIVLLPTKIFLIFFLLANAIFIVITGTGSREGPNILIVVVDALREDTLGISGYGHNTSPEIDKFARNSVIFKNAYTSSSWTKPSVASLFSALHPVRHNTLGIKLKLPEELNTLAEVLKNDGYKTFFLGGGNPFIGSKFSFDQGFDHYFNKKSDAAGLSCRFSKLLPELKKGKFFGYLHYMDVHLPYNKNKFNYTFSSRRGNYRFTPGEIKRRGIRELDRKGKLTENDKVELKALYDGQVRYVDEQIGILLEMLKSESMLKNTLVIITSDHGEEFWDHGGFEHGHSLYNELIRIPLIIGGNGLKSLIKEKSVSIIDIFPTILDVAKIPSSIFNFDGLSFQRYLLSRKGGVDRNIFATGIMYGRNKYCLIRNKKKIICNSINKNKVHELKNWKNKSYEYYEISSDPGESENLFKEKTSEVLKLVKLLNQFILLNPDFKKSEKTLGKDMQERLKTLGYL